MAGVKGRSGPPNNLNAVARPWRSFWRRKALRAEDRWVVPILERYVAAIESDHPEMSETERLMASIAQRAHGAQMLILAEAQRIGLPGLKELPKFMAVEQRALQALGLKRRVKSVRSLAEVIDAEYRDGPTATEGREESTS